VANSTLKGTAVLPNLAWIKSTYGESVWEQILARLTDEEREQVRFISGAGTYPVTLLSAVNGAFVDIACRGDRNSAGTAFRKMGHHIAEDNLGGIYSLFVRFASPEKVLGKIPSIVSTMYTGVTADHQESADGHGSTVHIRGLGELTYAGPRLCGWAEAALEKVGAKDVRVSERSWD
jgi:hypothetical protein